MRKYRQNNPNIKNRNTNENESDNKSENRNEIDPKNPSEGFLNSNMSGGRDSEERKISILIESILSRNHGLLRITESRDPFDVYLLKELGRRTFLLPSIPIEVTERNNDDNSNDGSSNNNDNNNHKNTSKIIHPSTSRPFVRTYQWEGVSWLLHLYHCGLGGILAGASIRKNALIVLNSGLFYFVCC